MKIIYSHEGIEARESIDGDVERLSVYDFAKKKFRLVIVEENGKLTICPGEEITILPPD